MARSIMCIGAGAALLGALAGAPASAQTFCDPSKPIVDHRSDGYRERGDRCEGVYVRQEVSGGFLDVVSFSLGEVSYRLDGDALSLAWPAEPAEQPVQIRAVSLRRNLHYQMDTRRPEGTASYAWPTDLLLQLGLRAGEVGVRAWTDLDWGRGAKELHLPLVVHQGEPGNDAAPYHLVVMPGLSLGGLGASLERLGDDERLETVFPESDLGGFYPAREPITLEIPAPEEPGIYRLRLIATADDGGPPVSTFVWFQHPGT